MGLKIIEFQQQLTSYSTNDVKSLYGIVGSAHTFTADTNSKY
jgi:hypothetical protein